MTLEIALLLAILVAALVLLAWERMSSDLVALLVLAALLLTRLVTPQQAVGGFGHPAVITIAAVFVLSAGLEETGALRALAAWLVPRGRGATRLLVSVMLTAAAVSAFVSGTLAVAVLLPVVLAVAAARRTPSSTLLVPLAFAIQIGGACTLIGSSTNLLVSSISERAGFAPFGMFELTPLGLLLLGTGVLYFVLGGRRLLPERRGTALSADFRLGDYVAELRVPARSELLGSTVRDARLRETHGVRILDLLRDGRRIWFPERETIQAGDHVLARGAVEDLMRLESEGRLELVPGAVLAERLESGERTLVEALVAPRSRLIGRTLRGLYFRHRYRAAVLALRRGGRALHEALTSVPLQLGDSLLLYGPPDEIERLRSDDDFLVLHDVEGSRAPPRRALRAIAVMALVVALAALEIVPILVATLLGCLAMVLTRCLSLDVAYRAIDWRVIVVLGALLPLAAAMEQWGAAPWLVERSLARFAHLGPLALLAVVYVATVALAEGTGNDTAAVLVAPLAIALAESADLDPRPFLAAVAFAAAASFATPRGHPANALVHNAGGYRRKDFARVGLPLNVLFLAITTLAIPRLWPF
jgi:di/tricarboxylate transporter